MKSKTQSRNLCKIYSQNAAHFHPKRENVKEYTLSHNVCVLFDFNSMLYEEKSVPMWVWWQDMSYRIEVLSKP